MGYRLEWRLVGRARQLLDSGTMDGDYADRPSALDALDSLLVTFPLWGCNEAEGYWWARRSSDADLEIQVSRSRSRSVSRPVRRMRSRKSGPT